MSGTAGMAASVEIIDDVALGEWRTSDVALDLHVAIDAGPELEGWSMGIVEFGEHQLLAECLLEEHRVGLALLPGCAHRQWAALKYWSRASGVEAS